MEISIGSIVAGDKLPVCVIAEAACEHLGDISRAKEMIAAAKQAGVDVIKFQLHLPEEMIPGSIQFWGGSMDDVLSKLNMDIDDQIELFEECKRLGIQYLCTPFCEKAASMLNAIGVPAFKTGSGEMTNLPMISTIASFGKPMIVSTGMATFDEISETVALIREKKTPFALMHCTSAYPPRYDQINLGVISLLKEKYQCIVGHSDHTPDYWTAIAAVSLGAQIVEKHFTLDKKKGGPDVTVSLDAKGLAMMVDGIRKVEKSLGTDKVIHEEEKTVRAWAHHSVVSIRDIAAGDLLTVDLIAVKRPGGGIKAKHYKSLLGRRASRNISSLQLLDWNDIEGDSPCQ